MTARPVETRMGKGKGPISYWVARVHPGQILFEFNGLTKALANNILENLSKKSPMLLKLISYSYDRREFDKSDRNSTN